MNEIRVGDWVANDGRVGFVSTISRGGSRLVAVVGEKEEVWNTNQCEAVCGSCVETTNFIIGQKVTAASKNFQRGEVVELGTTGKTAGLVRVLWFHNNGTKDKRTWFEPGRLTPLVELVAVSASTGEVV